MLLTIPIIILALLFALALNRDVRGIGTFRTLYYVPKCAFGGRYRRDLGAYLRLDRRRDLINATLLKVGIEPIPWLNDSALAMPAVAFTTIWWTVGFNTLVFLAGLQGINEELYDAAKVDGANMVRRFRHITLPGLRRTVLFVMVLQVIGSFQVFGQVEIMTAGGPAGATRTIVYYVWERAFQFWQLGYGAAMAFILFLVLLTISILQLIAFRDTE